MPYHMVKQQATLNILILKSLHIWIPCRSHKLTYTYFCESALIGQFHQVVWLIGSWVNIINQDIQGALSTSDSSTLTESTKTQTT